MSAREDIKVRIAALRAKTLTAGCTKDEAIAAAAKAAELMTKHGLDEADIVMAEAIAPESSQGRSWRSALARVIAHCTNSSVILTAKGWHFIGLAPGPDIAVYLREVTFRAVDSETKAFKAGKFYRRKRSMASKRDAAADFRDGIVEILYLRLLEMFGPGLDHAQLEQAKAARNRLFPDRQSIALLQRETRFDDAHAEGRRAGHGVALNHGVRGTGEAKRIRGPA